MEEDVTQSLAVLRNGGIILLPTDTVWCLGCDATRDEAAGRIFSVRNQPTPDGSVVLMENPALLDRYIIDVPEIAYDLAEITHTPLTLIFRGARNLSPLVVAENGSVSLRFTREAFSRALVHRFRKPLLVAPACLSGQAFPVSFSGIADHLVQAVDYVVKYRQEDETRPQMSSCIALGPGGLIDILGERT